MDNEKKPVNNLEGLLRFALQYTQNEDAPSRSILNEMDPERRQFLENVLSSMTIDVIAEFEKAVKTLNDTISPLEKKLDALDTIREYLDNMDNANNFVKIGGCDCVLNCLDSNEVSLKSSAASVIAEMAQNNPYCQEFFLKKHLLQKLVELITFPEVECNAMHALSCLIRNYQPCFKEFQEIGGLECLLCCLTSSQEKVFIKACFLINAICTEYPYVKDEFIKLGAAFKLSEHIAPINVYSPKLEITLAALDVLTNDVDKSVIKFAPALDQHLREILKVSDKRPEFEEISLHSRNIYNRIYFEYAGDTDR